MIKKLLGLSGLLEVGDHVMADKVLTLYMTLCVLV